MFCNFHQRIPACSSRALDVLKEPRALHLLTCSLQTLKFSSRLDLVGIGNGCVFDNSLLIIYLITFSST